MSQPSLRQLQDWLKAARTASALASSILLDHLGRLKNIREKPMAGLVSEADEAAERVIREALQRAAPQVAFLGEEGSHAQGSQAALSQDLCWVVDPLDGTTNYIHGMPVFCVSIALVAQGRPVLGLVEVPRLGEVYWGIRGQGSFLNQERLRVSARERIEDSLLATGFFRDQAENLRDQLKIFSDLVYTARGIRRAGAAAYDLCLVASGVYDVFWEKGLQPWDTAAGWLLVEEAGGQVLDYLGEPYRLGNSSLLAGSPHLAPEVLARIRQLNCR